MKRGEGLVRYREQMKAIKNAAGAGRKGYPDGKDGTSLEGKQKFKKDEASDKVYLLGNKSALMLRKAINEGLSDKPELNAIGHELYELAEGADWDKKKLSEAFRFLVKCQNTAIKELAVNASKFVIDKLIPDKVEGRKPAEEKSADELRKSLLGLFGKIRKRGFAGSESDDDAPSSGDASKSERTTVTGIVSVTRDIGAKTEGTPDRFLRASGGPTRQLSQEPEIVEGVVRSEPGSENLDDNRG